MVKFFSSKGVVMYTMLRMRDRAEKMLHPKLQEHIDLWEEWSRINLKNSLQWVNLWYNMVYGWSPTDEKGSGE